MATGSGSNDKTDELSQERYIRKAEMAARVEKLAQEHPEMDIASKGQWWAPSVDFTFDVKGRLPNETQKKLNACLQRIFDHKYAPDVVESALKEARGYIATDEDLLVQFDKIFGNPGVFDILHKHELEKEKNAAAEKGGL